MALDPAERARRLVMLVTGVLAPVSTVGLNGALYLMANRNPVLGRPGEVVTALLAGGELERETVEGETYCWPSGSADGHLQVARDVRLLAPFDPIVWDRRRFEHLWGWPYRFEAYTSPARRRLGYYAFPMLWGTSVIGWANVVQAGGRMDVEVGYAAGRPAGPAFKRALDAELARMERFLDIG